MKSWIMAILIGFFCFSCNSSDGADVISDLTNFQQDKQDKKGKKDKKNKDEKKDKKKDKDHTGSSPGRVHTGQVWELPAVLTEISGVAWYGNDKVAAVQDESGIIFIYNLRDNKIEREIPFAGKGDYEGIAVSGDLFYVLRSDGTIIEVSGNGKSAEHRTRLTVKNDTEGLFLDKANGRLLIALKGSDESHPGQKTIYSFDLSSRKLSDQPVISIDPGSSAFSGGKGKKDGFQPSDLAIHPQTGDVYAIDGGDPALLIMDSSGAIKAFHSLDRSVFPQPEGITFSPAGTLYISTEGVKGTGKIVQVNISETGQLTVSL